MWGIETDIVEMNYWNSLVYTYSLNLKLKSYENVKTIFLEIPSDSSQIKKMDQIIDSSPEITFYTYCTIEPMNYWLGSSDEEKKDEVEKYNQTYEMLSKHSNVVPFIFYSMEWMINNDANYTENGSLNEEASYYLFTAFARHDELFEKEDILQTIGESEEINTEKLDGEKVLIFGDSIWDMNRTSMGPMSILSNFTGVEVDNRSVGGSSVAISDRIPQNFFVCCRGVDT